MLLLVYAFLLCQQKLRWKHTHTQIIYSVYLASNAAAVHTTTVKIWPKLHCEKWDFFFDLLCFCNEGVVSAEWDSCNFAECNETWDDAWIYDRFRSHSDLLHFKEQQRTTLHPDVPRCIQKLIEDSPKTIVYLEVAVCCQNRGGGVRSLGERSTWILGGESTVGNCVSKKFH